MTTLQRTRPSPVDGRLVPPLRRSTLAVVSVPVILVATTVFACWWIGVSVPALLAGLEDSGRLLARMWPPRMANPLEILRLLVETLLIGIAGTGLATLASLPVAFAASRRFQGPAAVHATALAVTVVTRAVPTLVFAIVFVRLFGLGPLAGVLAVAFHSVGMLAKLLADALEELDPVPTEALRATGASSLQVAFSAVLSRIFPQLTSIVLYRLDINIRASAVLGLVGAGGIGMALQTAMGSLNYQTATGIILVIIALIVALEALSVSTRRRLGGHADSETRAEVLPEGHTPAEVGWDGRRVRRVLVGVLALAVFVYSIASIWPDPARISRAWPQLVDVLRGFWPPDFSAGIFLGTMESLLMAVAGTTVGAVAGLVLAVLTARRVTPLPWLAPVLRLVVVLVRGIPDLVYALVFVAALGLGPFPGFLTLCITCTALAAKFFTDSLEEVNPAPREALSATGAGRAQVFLSTVWPQFVPAFAGNTLFITDLALRESIVLGIVGAGGIGYLLHESITTLSYDATAAILLAIMAAVALIEALARFTRKHVL